MSNMKDFRTYFEDGCLCIINKEIDKVDEYVPDEEALNYYMENCKCSRHPEYYYIKNQQKGATNENMV